MSKPPRVLDVDFVTSAPTPRALPAPGLPEVAIVGRSNVGKSSLIAALIGRKKMVRISRRPGRTRALNFFRVRTDAGPVMLVDLPGYGYAEAPAAEQRRWGPLITEFLYDRGPLCLIVALFDPRRPLSDDDDDVLEMLAETRRPVTIAATKIDKLPKSKRRPAVEGLGRAAGFGAVAFSAKTGQGVDELWLILGRACGVIEAPG